MEKCIIIGSGPAAHTATIYAARASLNPLMFEGMMAAGVPAGGQLMITTEVENFPGFPEGISGPELMTRMRGQSVKHGARIITETVTKVDLGNKPFKVFVEDKVYETQSLILATGATAKRLNLPGEERLWQRGISACAVCDGGLPIFRNKDLAVIGGGDSAAEEALYLTKFANRVYLIHRRDALRASKAMQKRVFDNKKIEIVWDSIPEEVVGENSVSGLVIKNVKSKEKKTLEINGLFYAIGHTPNAAFLENQLETDDAGYIQTLPGSTKTQIAGVFACGDVKDKVYRQAVTAAGSGCMAALEAERYLGES